MTVIEARTQVYSFRADAPRLAWIDAAGLLVRSDDDALDLTCSESVFAPSPGATIRYELRRGALRVLVSPPPAGDESPEPTGRLLDSDKGPFYGEIEFVEADACDGPSQDQFLIWGVGSLGAELGSDAGASANAMLISGEIEVFGRSIGLSFFGTPSGALYRAFDEGLPIPPGSIVTPRVRTVGDADASVSDIEGAMMRGFARRDGDAFVTRVTTNAHEVFVTAPGTMSNRDRVDVNLFSRVFRDPSMQVLQFAFLGCLALIPIFLEIYQTRQR